MKNKRLTLTVGAASLLLLASCSGLTEAFSDNQPGVTQTQAQTIREDLAATRDLLENYEARLETAIAEGEDPDIIRHLSRVTQHFREQVNEFEARLIDAGFGEGGSTPQTNQDILVQNAVRQGLGLIPGPYGLYAELAFALLAGVFGGSVAGRKVEQRKQTRK